MSAARRLLARLQPCATTGIGSLPFDNSAEAVAHVFASYDLPYCPQLPTLDGDMVAEWLGAPGAACTWTPERDLVRPSSFTDFLLAVQAVPPPAGLVKLQVTGPCTLAIAMSRDGHGDDVAGLACELGVWLGANAAERIADLAAVGVRALLVIDEPLLDQVVLPPLTPIWAWQPLVSSADAWGLHLCGPAPWAIVDMAAPDALFLDLARYPLSARGGSALAHAIRRGARIGLGALAVDGTLDPAEGLDVVVQVAAALELAGIQPATLARAALITPSCGSGAQTPSRARDLAESTHALAAAARSALLRGAPRETVTPPAGPGPESSRPSAW